MRPKEVVILVFSSFMVFGCADKLEDEPINNIVLSNERTYNEIKEFEITLETIFDVESESFYAYFYSLTCSHCHELKDFIIEKGLERQDIYFIQSSANDQFTTDPNLVINAENPGDIYILGYPTMLKIENKKVTKNLVGNDEIIQELK